MYSVKLIVLMVAVIAMVSAKPHGPVGGVTKLEGEKLEEAKQQLNTSLTKLASGDGPSYSVVEVIEASHQVVSGSLYKYKTVLKNDQGEKNCNVEIWSQPWLDNGIQVTFKCENEDELRVSYEPHGPVGGVTKLEGEKLEEAKQQLNTSLAKLASGDGPSYSVVEVIEAYHQVVSGSLYKCKTVLKNDQGEKNCNVEIWSQPWLDNGIQVTFKCENEDELRVSYEPHGPVGGVTKLEGEKLEEAKQQLNTSLTKLASGDGPSYSVVEVIEASHQVVSGSLYKYKTVLKNDQGEKNCNVEIWSQPWLDNGIQVTFKCENEDELRVSYEPHGPVGGVTKLEGEKLEEAKQQLNTSLTKLASGDGPSYSVVEVIEAYHQVVSGSLYKCKTVLKNDQGEKNCNVEIWSQPWLDNGIQVTFKCENEDELRVSYEPHGPVGGVTKLEGEKLEEAKQQLNTSLTKLASGDGPSYSVVEVIEASHQVVSGSLYKYKTVLKNDQGEKNCNVEIWSQPWLDNGIQVTFKCENEDELRVSYEPHGPVGGVTKLEGEKLEEAKQQLNTSLTKLASGDGPSYSVVEVIEASHQVVSGSLYKYKTVLKNDQGEKNCNVEIWSQPWLDNGIQVTFKCENEDELRVSYEPHGPVGGVTKLEGEKLEEAKQQLNTSLTKLASGDGPSYSVVEVIEASHQVVSGSLYKYKTVLKNDQGEKNCNVEIWSQPWLDNGIQVTSKCENEEELRVSYEPHGPVGGVTKLEGEKLEEAKQQLNTSLTKLASGDGPSYSVVEVIEASHQVVSGSLYKYKTVLKNDQGEKNCNVEIWSQPWLDNGIQVTFKCENEDELRVSYEPHGPVGGVTKLEGEKLEEAKQQLNTSLTKLASGDGPSYSVVEVIEASHQVVSGSLYKYKTVLKNDQGEKNCNVEIWSQPWLDNGIQVTSKCENEEELRVSYEPHGPVGGVTKLEGEKLEEAKQQLNTSLTKLASGDGPSYSVVEVIEAYYQVVSGSLYKYKTVLKNDQGEKNCNVEIWSQPWLDNGIQVTFKCENEDELRVSYEPHGPVGGVTKLEGEKLEEAKQQLNTSLTKLASGDGPSYSVVEVIEASHQVVSGSLYKYKTVLKNDQGEKNCNVEIWSQPWLDNGIQVTFKCENEDEVVKKHSA